MINKRKEQKSMHDKPNYLILLLIIIAGVTVGNLLSDWISEKLNPTTANNIAIETPAPVIETPELETETLIDSTENSNNKTQQETVEPETITTPKLTQSELIEQRRLDKDGVRLGKTCDEWRQADADMDTPSSKRGVNKHCGDYELYLETGVITPKF